MVIAMRKELKDILNKTTIKVSVPLRDKLAEIGNKDETFEDVIWRMVRRSDSERSGEIVTKKSSMIQYKRKKEFVELIRKKGINLNSEKAGFEYEYNIPSKKEGEWELDIKIVKVYYGQKSYNPSEFFGVTNEDKYLSYDFTQIYFQILSEIFTKEFGITKLRNFSADQMLKILEWRKIYYENKLSEESFINDVEDVLRDSSDKKIDAKTKNLIDKSVMGRK